MLTVEIRTLVCLMVICAAACAVVFLLVHSVATSRKDALHDLNAETRAADNSSGSWCMSDTTMLNKEN